MLKEILKVNGVQKLSTSQQKSLQGGDGCATNLFCHSRQDCPDPFIDRCVKNRCHIF